MSENNMGLGVSGRASVEAVAAPQPDLTHPCVLPPCCTKAQCAYFNEATRKCTFYRVTK
jgi:hypothetical protein